MPAIPLKAHYHASAALNLPKKNTQNKDDLDPSSSEYTQSGSSDDVAKTDAAFDSKTTLPEDEKKEASKVSNLINTVINSLMLIRKANL